MINKKHLFQKSTKSGAFRFIVLLLLVFSIKGFSQIVVSGLENIHLSKGTQLIINNDTSSEIILNNHKNDTPKEISSKTQLEDDLRNSKTIAKKVDFEVSKKIKKETKVAHKKEVFLKNGNSSSEDSFFTASFKNNKAGIFISLFAFGLQPSSYSFITTRLFNEQKILHTQYVVLKNNEISFSFFARPPPLVLS